MASTKPTVNTRIMGPIKPGDHLPTHQLLILGLQHAFTMFGATVLVPGIPLTCTAKGASVSAPFAITV
jgi:xanthine/uracil permease